MKISAIIERLEKIKNESGDLRVYSTGYYGDVEVEEVKLTTRGDRGVFIDSRYTKKDPTECVVLLPGSEP